LVVAAVAATAAAGLAAPEAAGLRLPAVVGSNMVLQRGQAVPIWGWDAPGRKVTVRFGGQAKTAQAGGDGKWMLRLDALEASDKPAEMTIAGSTTIVLKNVLVGEVWLCSGQSNMEQGMRMIKDSAKEIAAAKHRNMRLFLVPKRPSAQPLPDVKATWQPCTPQTVVQGGWGGFSGVAYFFGLKIHKELGVPVGLIEASWGGTRIEPWTPPAGFAAVKRFVPVARQLEAAAAKQQAEMAQLVGRVERWLTQAKAAKAAGRTIPPLPASPARRINHQGPAALYNGMVHAVVPFGIRGAIWYQGESNNGEGMLYCDRMAALIAGWRAVWKQQALSFYFVQLAPFRYGRADPENLCGIWEAQTAALAIPDTGMAVTVDIGNVRDIHPRNKQDVGRRLALWALAKNYAKKGLVYSGPLYAGMKVEGDKVRISFDHVGGGLVSRDGKPLSHFTIAGKGKKFVEAEAAIDGETVVVSSDAVLAPTAVRFGWKDSAEPNLSNKDGLPASPFRTDRTK
jgi:sialate O-acetylesterase